MKRLLAASLLLAGLSQFGFSGSASAQTIRQWDFSPGACPTSATLPEPERSSFGLGHPAYYFPPRSAAVDLPAFPAALTVARVPCPNSEHAEIRLRITSTPGREIVFPRIDIYQRGIHYGCAGAKHEGMGFTGWPGYCSEFTWFEYNGRIYDAYHASCGFITCILTSDALSFGGSALTTLYSRSKLTAFDPDLPFTLRVRGNESSTMPPQVYEVPGRGRPGNVASIPRDLAGMWWNPAQPGSGMILDRNERGVMFATWLTYDDTGKSTWFVMPNGQETERGVIVGAVHALRGQPFSQPDASNTLAGEIVGQFRFTFSNGSAGEFRYTVNGRSGVEPIERFVMRTANGTECHTPVRGALEVSGLPGWAANLVGSSGTSTQCATHATLLTYDDAGSPMWVYGALLPTTVLPTGDDSSNSAQHGLILGSIATISSALYGALNRPSGTPYGQPWDAQLFSPGAPVGTWNSSYVGTYPEALNRVAVRINGVQRTLAFKRFVFEY